MTTATMDPPARWAGVGPPTAEEERALARRISRGDAAALGELVGRFDALARDQARKYPVRGREEDLAQWARLGLVEAARTFDPGRGCRFSTHATWVVRARLLKSLRDERGLIRIPGVVSRASRGLPVGRAVSAATLAAARRAARCLAGAATPGLRPGGDPMAGLVAPPAATPDHDVDPASVPALLAAMPPREAEVIRLRFGLGGGAPMTLKEIGGRIGVGKERARQIEAEALARLRRVLAVPAPHDGKVA